MTRTTLPDRRPAAEVPRASRTRSSRSGTATRPSRRRSSAARRGTAPTSTCSTTARRSPTACRTTATCSPGSSRTPCRATARCAASASSAASAGTATACRPRWRPRRSSASPAARRSPSYGIDKFNDFCRTLACCSYTDDWERYVTRQARWVDFDNDYKTLDLTYMESVMWAFKTLWDKGLVYEGFRVLPYCWRCETPLSQHRDADGRRLQASARTRR